jgi:tetratricopeptide (TPR) repeat protein
MAGLTPRAATTDTSGMRHIVNLVVFLAGGAVVALATSARRDGQVRAPMSPAVADRRPDALAEESGQVRVLLERLERVEEEVAALRAIVAERRDHRVDAPGAAGSPAESEDPALDEAALRKLKEDAVRGGAESAERRAALEALARVATQSKDPQLRAEAWLEQGNIYFQAKDYRHAAEVWRRSVDEVGLVGDTGQTACFQLGWALCFSGDAAAAFDASRRVMDTPDLSRPVYANARWASAVFAAAKGDAPTARALYEGMIAEYGDDSDQYYRRIATMSRQGLAQLR